MTERIVNAAIWAMVGLIAGAILVAAIRSCEPTEVPGRGAALPPAQSAPAGLEIEMDGCGVKSLHTKAIVGIDSGQPPISLQAVAPAGVCVVASDSALATGYEPKPEGGPGGLRFWRVTIHHTATSPDNPAERVRSIDADHRSRGWDGVGYHFLVAEDGTVFPGRPLDRQGAHIKGENGGNLGIAFIGTYTDRPPPEAALASVRRLFVAWGFGPEAVYFHRDLAATECPGTWDKGVLFTERRRNEIGGGARIDTMPAREPARKTKNARGEKG